LVSGTLAGAGALPPRPPSGPNCNARGLTALGEVLINEMIDKHMIIDIDHTSGRTFDDILDIAEQRHYPAIASGHTGIVDLGINGHRHEGNKTPEQLERIREIGGLVAVILHQGDRSEMRAYQQADGSVRVPYTCDNSSEAWAQAYLYAVEQMQGGAVAIGSDFNGLAGLPAPRFGSEACGGKADPGYTPVDEVQYGTKSYAHIGTLQQMTIGNKTFDYNTDGLANVGMLPDFIADLQEIGPNDLTANDLDPLFSSAEAYVHMWESAEDTTPPSVSCGTPSPDWQATDIVVNCTASDDVAGLADPADAGFTLSTNVAAGTETATATTSSKMVCDSRNNCTAAGPFTGLKVDKKAPDISILVPAATSYVINEQVLASYACTDGGSGLATCAGNVPSGSAIDTATAGSKTFTVTTGDNVNNQDSSTVAYVVTYNICVLYDETKAVKSGSAIAIKLALCDADGTNLSSAAIVVHATEVTNLATNVSVPPVAAGDANPGNDFRYDPTAGPTGGYVFNLKTTDLSPGAYSLSFSVAGDPVLHAVPFNVR
jgi:microsomal dipeptidase-like Zn-dependent dipeptidase